MKPVQKILTPVQKMEKLIKYLPNKDIPLADKFIKNRDFLSLRELVDSAYIKVEKNNTKSNPKEEYLGINLDALRDLSVIVDNYLRLLGEDMDELNIYEEDNDEEIINDEW